MKQKEAHPAKTSEDPRWRKIVARDKSADGEFWYSVSSTGIYCRPSCPSRVAKPENVTIHASLEEARKSGCRPCKRCNPEGSSHESENAALVERACRIIEKSEGSVSLTALADAVELSPSYFHRIFKAQTGLTPKAYASAHRAATVRDRLVTAGTVTEAIHDAGFGSNARFYETSAARLGMTPTQFRSGGSGESLQFAVGETSLGAVLVASSVKGIAAILMGDDPELLVRDLQDRFPKADLVGDDPAFEHLIAKVIALVEAPSVGLDLPLDIRGTAFQQRVWQTLRDIPVGETATYQEIAQLIGNPNATRAVAGACAANSIAVAIPCHRVIRQDGSISGYRWGVERKRTLLAREAQCP